MKRLAALAAVAVLTFAAWTATAVSESNSNKQSTPPPQRCLYPAFKKFSARVWAVQRWQRGDPPSTTIEAAHKRIGCAPVRHRKAMKRRWREDKAAYYQHRSAKLWVTRVTPYYGCTSIGGCHMWAIPAYIVDCESGGRYNDPSAPNGAYSLLAGPLQGVSTWEEWRPGWAAGYSLPYEAPAKAQDEAAHHLWVAYGSEPWSCA